jgi:methionyl aminopeptidase
MIILKSEQELDYLRASNKIVGEVLQALGRALKPGIRTIDLDLVAEELIRQRGAEPAFKGYQGYPGVICASINEEVVHGIPGPKRLRPGDIVGIDVGVRLNGYYGDGAATFPVGRIDPEVRRLLEVTKNALHRGIDQARFGNRLSDISHAIQSYVEANGFSVVRDFVGHGIGKDLHEEPQIPNFGEPHQGPRLKPGMVLAIEPMVNMGSFEVRILQDDWTVVTQDGRPSAHFEHSIAITASGPDILSR